MAVDARALSGEYHGSRAPVPDDAVFPGPPGQKRRATDPEGEGAACTARLATTRAIAEELDAAGGALDHDAQAAFLAVHGRDLRVVAMLGAADVRRRSRARRGVHAVALGHRTAAGVSGAGGPV